MTAQPARSFYHLCICVSDLDRSLRFYCDALGFTRNETFQIGNEVSRLTGIDGEIALTSVYLGLSGVRLELWAFAQPAALARPRQPMNMIGLTHFAIRVDDIDRALEAVARHGGTCLPETRTRCTTDGFESDIVYVLDPDGVRVELLWMPEHMQLALTR